MIGWGQHHVLAVGLGELVGKDRDGFLHAGRAGPGQHQQVDAPCKRVVHCPNHVPALARIDRVFDHVTLPVKHRQQPIVVHVAQGHEIHVTDGGEVDPPVVVDELGRAPDGGGRPGSHAHKFYEPLCQRIVLPPLRRDHQAPGPAALGQDRLRVELLQLLDWLGRRRIGPGPASDQQCHAGRNRQPSNHFCCRYHVLHDRSVKCRFQPAWRRSPKVAQMWRFYFTFFLPGPIRRS